MLLSLFASYLAIFYTFCLMANVYNKQFGMSFKSRSNVTVWRKRVCHKASFRWIWMDLRFLLFISYVLDHAFKGRTDWKQWSFETLAKIFQKKIYVCIFLYEMLFLFYVFLGKVFVHLQCRCVCGVRTHACVNSVYCTKKLYFGELKLPFN